MALYEKTPEHILDSCIIDEAIIMLINEKQKYPDKPKEPKAFGFKTPEEYEAYANTLRLYNNKKLDYTIARESVDNLNRLIDVKIEACIRHECNLQKLPDWQQAKVWYYACDRSSGGYQGIYNTLLNLMDLFEE